MSAKSIIDQVRVEEHTWGTAYHGSRVALESFGFEFELRFPGDPGNRVCSQRYHVGNRKVWITKETRNRFRVHVPFSREETVARNRTETLFQERDRIQKAMKELPTCPADYRASLERCSIFVMKMILEYARTGSAGYRVSAPSSARIAAALGVLTDELQEAEIVFDSTSHAEALNRYQAKLAAVDPAFQSFASKLIAGMKR